MLNWLKRRKSADALPEYSSVRAAPSRPLPDDLAGREGSGEHLAMREAIRRSLLEPPRRPPTDRPLFVTLLTVKHAGVLTIPLPPEGAHCLPIFSSPVRAGDYVRTLLRRGPPVRYLTSSPAQLVGLLEDLRRTGIEDVTLDRCPRCESFAVAGSVSVTTAEKAIDWWSIFKAGELARLELYLAYAWAAARAGRLEIARDVALETVAHVSIEDPRAHLLLGQIAVARRDRTLLREARSFLRFLKLGSWERKLDEAIRSGAPDFGPVG